jgi:para-aminobenzoate synthetase/4-amino-4-deoxychorismate lyase
VTESSIANVVVSIDGELFTPPLESGLLAGVFRNQLLAEGKIKERTISVEELQRTRDFFLINSVRKWIRATLQRF